MQRRTVSRVSLIAGIACSLSIVQTMSAPSALAIIDLPNSQVKPAIKPAAKSALKPAVKSLALAAPAASSCTAEITAYEKKFFERSFDGESDDHRLDRLENFIFGATSTGAPAARIAKIDQVVPLASTHPSSNGLSGSQSSAGLKQSSDTASSLLESPGHYPHITALEGQLLGNTYDTQPLPERLSRLEVKAFGKASTSKDLEERTDAIDKYMQAKRKPKDLMIGQPSLMDKMLAEDEGESLADQVRHYDSADDDPGSIVKRQAIAQEIADAQKTAPPTTEERTLSRVAWCEQQMFGHSFPEMHLLPRLHQLNAELFPNDKEKDIQLMDRIDVIVREVVLRKQPHQPKTT